MKIKSVTYDMQKYGVLSGKPYIILKLAGVKEEKDTSYEEICNLIKKNNCQKILVTGAEPLLQQLELIQLFTQLKKEYEITIRTDGLIMPDINLRNHVKSWIVEPWYSTSGNTLARDSILFFKQIPNSLFEFKVRGQIDFINVRKFIREYLLDTSKIHIVPVSKNIEQLRELTEVLIDKCLTHNYTLVNPMLPKLWFKEKKQNERKSHRNSKLGFSTRSGRQDTSKSKR